ncbi:sugar transporter SWEET1 [Anabrus simplex]|uniref:sugar transporter SWEET1 n=1 Tax=Anabrus simplex TaxID=316456 RepID=UPI0034DCF1A8
MDLSVYLQISASYCTVLQFLSPIWPFAKVVKLGTTGTLPSLQFVVGFLSCSTWLRYGWIVNDSAIVTVNAVGAGLYLAYVALFYKYSPKKSVVLKQLFVSVIIQLLTAFYDWYEDDADALRSTIGLLCLFLTVSFFAAPLAQVKHVIQCRSTESLSFVTIVATFIVTLQWFIYGIILDDYYIQIPNIMGCFLSLVLLSLFCIYPSHTLSR